MDDNRKDQYPKGRQFANGRANRPRTYESKTKSIPDPYSKVWDPTREPVPSGIYKATLVGGEFIRSRTTSNEGYCFCYEVTEDRYAGRIIKDRIWFDDNSLVRTARTLGIMGINGREGLENDCIPVGLLLEVIVEKFLYGNSYRNRVNWVDVVEDGQEV